MCGGSRDVNETIRQRDRDRVVKYAKIARCWWYTKL